MWMWGKVRNALNSVASAQQAKLWQAITDWQKATFNLLKCTHSNMEWINSIVESLYVILLGAWLNTSTPHQPSELSVSLNNATTLTSPPPPQKEAAYRCEHWWSWVLMIWVKMVHSLLSAWVILGKGREGWKGGGGSGGDSLHWSLGGRRLCRDTCRHRNTDFPPWKCGGKLMKP